MMRWVRRLVWLASGEWLLVGQANGGDVVLLRSLWTAALVFFGAIGLEDRLAPGATWDFDGAALRRAAHDRFEWLGAVFAACYIAYYTRFSSQWGYLAGLYNQLMAAQVQTPRGRDAERDAVFDTWWAAFIEDAEDVHLALKPNFAVAIAGLLGNPEVRATYVHATHNGAQRLDALERRLRAKLPKGMFDELRASGSRQAEDRSKGKARLTTRSGSASADDPPKMGDGNTMAASE